MSTFRSQGRQNSRDMQLAGLPVEPDEAGLFIEFLDANDYAANSRKTLLQDYKKFVRWFAESNKEMFSSKRVTTRDVTDFKDHLRRVMNQAVSTVNRCLVTLRRFFGWLVEQDQLSNRIPPRQSRS